MAGDVVRFLDFFIEKTSMNHDCEATLSEREPLTMNHEPSGFAQLLHDGPYLSGGKRLAAGFVARRLKLFPKLGATTNPRHQVAHGRAWTAVRKVHQRQFLLRVCTNFQFTIHTSYILHLT